MPVLGTISCTIPVQEEEEEEEDEDEEEEGEEGGRRRRGEEEEGGGGGGGGGGGCGGGYHRKHNKLIELLFHLNISHCSSNLFKLRLLFFQLSLQFLQVMILGRLRLGLDLPGEGISVMGSSLCGRREGWRVGGRG